MITYDALYHCCSSRVWVDEMLKRWTGNREELLRAASEIWRACGEADWREAFAGHPKIGESTKDTRAAAEQAGTRDASALLLAELAEANKLYESRFGYIFIVCATDKSAGEMLELLKTRLKNRPEEEILVAMKEQEKITLLRLQKILP